MIDEVLMDDGVGDKIEVGEEQIPETSWKSRCWYWYWEGIDENVTLVSMMKSFWSIHSIKKNSRRQNFWVEHCFHLDEVRHTMMIKLFCGFCWNIRDFLMM